MLGGCFPGKSSSLSSKVECYFFKSSVASRLQCLFYNCLLNYDSLFPDGALPSTCTQSLLVQSYSTSRSSSSPSPLRAIEEILRRRFPPPPRLQQFSNDVICGLNLSLLRTRGNHSAEYCAVRTVCQLRLVTELLHAADSTATMHSLLD